LPAAFDQRKICSGEDLSVLPVQVERKARVWPSGDQMGDELEQLLAPLMEMIFPLAGLGFATSVRCGVEPSRPRSVQATVVPSGERATPLGWATRVNCWFGLAVSGAGVSWALAVGGVRALCE
jgi:hypothetical protein